MKPIAPLMIEHRLIERMVGLLKKELDKIEKTGKYNPQLIFDAVDFFRTYADRTHHGKEEDILFKQLAKKKMSKEHKKMMDDLLKEHVIARKNVKGLLEANEAYVKGDAKAAAKVAGFLKTLIGLYPPHIAKEDKEFFLPVMAYFSEDEQQKMLKESYEFDMKMIHEKYSKVVQKYE